MGGTLTGSFKIRGTGNIVAMVSGGTIDRSVFARIMTEATEPPSDHTRTTP